MSTTATARSADRGAPEPAYRLIRDRLIGWAGRQLRRQYVRDCLVGLGFLVLAAWVGHGLWPDPTTRVLALNPADQTLIEWFLAVDTRVLLGEHGLVTDRLNVPDGVNLVANATSLTLGVLLAPVTLTLGAPVAFAVLTVGNLAGTGIAWYLLFGRGFGAHRAVAAAGGAFCGFAPAMISHSNSHWHMTAQWLVPPIIWAVVRLARAAEVADRRRTLTSGAILAVLVVVQYFLGAEVLYLTAVALLLLSIPYAVLRRDWAARALPWFLAGMAVAVGIASALLAYPLWAQFAGPMSVSDGPFSPSYYSADLVAWVSYSPLSAAGSEAAGELATGPAEYNTFLGISLVLVIVGAVIWLRRSALVLATAFAAVVMFVLSLGPELVVNQERTGIALPYRLLAERPVVDGALPQRYAMAVVPLLAVILVLALERARTAAAAAPAPPGLPAAGAGTPGVPAGASVRMLVPVAVALALAPLFPTPLPATDRPPVPEFISGGHWQECVAPGGVLVPVPLPTPQRPEPMRWAAAANAEFALPEGFFIGPYGRGGSAAMGVYPRPTSQLLAQVAQGRPVPAITPAERVRAAADLAYWGADCVVLGPGQPYQPELLAALEQLLGRPGEPIADAWIWRF